MMPIRGSLIEIGSILREQRERLGQTQAQLAARAAVTRSTVQRIEAGTLNPTWGLVVALAQALDLQPVLVPRERLRAVEVVMRQRHDAIDVPPLAGGEW
jgi:transcriptional regulator with XRE-family HTH domain